MKIKVSTNDKQCLNENLCRCLILDRNGWDLRDNPVGSYWCSTIHDAVAPEWHYTLWDVAVVEIPTMPVWLVCAPPTRTSIVFYIHNQPEGSRWGHWKGEEKKERERKIKSLLVQNGARLFKQPNDKDTTLTVDGQHKICSTFLWYTTTFSVSSSFLTWFC